MVLNACLKFLTISTGFLNKFPVPKENCADVIKFLA
jgi:hypothetical protein